MEVSLLVYQRRTFFSKFGTEQCPVELYQGSRRNSCTKSSRWHQVWQKIQRSTPVRHWVLILCKNSARHRSWWKQRVAYWRRLV